MTNQEIFAILSKLNSLENSHLQEKVFYSPLGRSDDVGPLGGNRPFFRATRGQTSKQIWGP